MKTVALDFDGVIHDWAHPKPGRKMGLPMEGTQEALTLLKSAGYTILIHSCNRPQVIRDFMHYYKLPFDFIWEEKGKPIADWYVDDNALRFTSWHETLTALL